jgi:hypothetical protein
MGRGHGRIVLPWCMIRDALALIAKAKIATE